MSFLPFEEYIKITESLDADVARFGIWREWIKGGKDNINPLHESNSADPIRSKISAMPDSEALSKAEKVMQMAKIKILNHFEWFKPYLDIMPPIAKKGAGSTGPDGIGTMATSGTAIYYDPKFVLVTYEMAKQNFKMSEEDKKRGPLKSNMDGTKWYSDYACFVIIHEIMHNSLKHFMRQDVDIDSKYLSKADIHYLWNIAMDYEINRILKNELTASIEMFPGGVDLEEGPYEVPEDEKDFFRTQTCETIFWRLFDQLEEKRKKAQEDQSDEDDGDGDGDDGDGDDGGQNGGGDSQESVKAGDIIQDNDTGEYGRVISVSGDDVEWDVISKEEAMSQLYPDQTASFKINQFKESDLENDPDLNL